MKDLIDGLAARFGLSNDQAKAAAGTVMTVIHSKLPTGDWQAVVAKVPEIQQWSAEAPTVSSSAVQGTVPPDSRRLLLSVLEQHGLSGQAAPDFALALLEAMTPMIGAGQVAALRKELIGKPEGGGN